MTTPDIDSRDYITNQEYPDQTTSPKELWVVYYFGLGGRWQFCLPSFFKENAIKHANALHKRQPRILHYTLDSDTQHVFKVTKKVKKVRKIRQAV